MYMCVGDECWGPKDQKMNNVTKFYKIISYGNKLMDNKSHNYNYIKFCNICPE